jgi:hypothetical protein
MQKLARISHTLDGLGEGDVDCGGRCDLRPEVIRNAVSSGLADGKLGCFDRSFLRGARTDSFGFFKTFGLMRDA